jgi:hypothetical protein
MISTDKGRFQITFENGYTVSVINGFGSYTENHFNIDLMNPEKDTIITSKDCEIAILHNDKFVTRNFIDNIGDDVKGYIDPKELVDILYKVKNYKGD